MLMPAVDTYLAVRRAAGFALVPIEGHLRHFARFATARGDTHVVASTAIAWATMAPSEAQRHYRLQTVARLARFLAAEDRGTRFHRAGCSMGAARVRSRISSVTMRSGNFWFMPAVSAHQGPYDPRPIARGLACSPSLVCGWRKPWPCSLRR